MRERERGSLPLPPPAALTHLPSVCVSVVVVPPGWPQWLYENPDVWPGGKAPNGGFVDCVAAASLHAGFLTLLQVSGLGRMRPNTVVMGYKQDWQQCSDDVVVGCAPQSPPLTPAGGLTPPFPPLLFAATSLC